MARSEGYTKQRLLYVGPVAVGIVGALAAFAVLVASEVVATVDTLDRFDWSSIVWGTVVVTAASVLTAFVFNLVAPILGGVPVWLASPTEDPPPSADPPGDAPSDDHGGK